MQIVKVEGAVIRGWQVVSHDLPAIGALAEDELYLDYNDALGDFESQVRAFPGNSWEIIEISFEYSCAETVLQHPGDHDGESCRS